MYYIFFKLCIFYFVSDYVYFESSSTSPFQIRRIEELNKVCIADDVKHRIIEATSDIFNNL